MQRAIKAAPGWLGSLFVCLYYTGLRVEQALSLRREDLDLDRLVLRIAPELGKTTAEQAGREMPVSAHFGAWVREAPPVDGGWLVPCAWKRRRARPRDAAAAWTRSGVRKEVWGGRPHHAFRAGFMSSLKREGVELEVIEVLVGHAPTPTAKHYFDPEAFPLRDAVGKIPPHGGA
jgi:integrase